MKCSFQLSQFRLIEIIESPKEGPIGVMLVGEPETAAKAFYFCKLLFRFFQIKTLKLCCVRFVVFTSKRCSIRVLKQWVWLRKAAAAVHCGRFSLFGC